MSKSPKSTLIPLTLAGFTLQFEVKSQKMMRAIQKRYSGYSKTGSKRNQAYSLSLSVTFTRSYFLHTGKIVETGGVGDHYTISKGDFFCEWRGKKGQARLHESIFTFDACLRVVLATLLVPKNGVLLHSSAIIWGRQACVFSGKSEAGKSTIAQLSGKKVLNDEIIALKITDQNKLKVYGTPFWGKKGTGPVYPGAYPLKGLYFLHKSKVIHKEKIDVLDSLNPFLQVVCYFDKRPQNIKYLMDLCLRILQTSSNYRLYFDKSPSFLQIL